MIEADQRERLLDEGDLVIEAKVGDRSIIAYAGRVPELIQAGRDAWERSREDALRLLETHAIACAVEVASEDDLVGLEALAGHEYTYDDWDSYGAFLEGNREFHLALAPQCGNERLVRVLRDLLEGMQRFFFLGLVLGQFVIAGVWVVVDLITGMQGDAIYTY